MERAYSSRWREKSYSRVSEATASVAGVMDGAESDQVQLAHHRDRVAVVVYAVQGDNDGHAASADFGNYRSRNRDGEVAAALSQLRGESGRWKNFSVVRLSPNRRGPRLARQYFAGIR
jgi:hypothetical protein